MNTQQIFTALQNNLWHPHFYTVCAADQLPKIDSLFYPAALIVNTVNQFQKGVHWQAIWLNNPDTIPEFFCSFGQAMPSHIKTFLLELDHHTCLDKCFLIQQPTSSACGLFALDYVLFRSYGGSRVAYFDRYSNTNFTENERVLRTLWSGDFDHLRYIVRNTADPSFLSNDSDI